MNKKIIKDTVSLVLITLIAALLLSFVFELTKDTIEEATAKERFESYEAVFESAKSFKDMDIGSDPIPDNLLPKGVTVEEFTRKIPILRQDASFRLGPRTVMEEISFSLSV